MSATADLRSRAEALAGPLPPLLAAAEHLASGLLLGDHGRRRAGMGDEFWQFRPAQPGDEARSIDWRRSARSDGHFVREREWQAAQSVVFWVDGAASMRFASDSGLVEKRARAQVLALALAVLLVRGGERIGLTAMDSPPRSGEVQLLRVAAALADEADAADYGAPNVRGMLPHSRAVFLSDFMGDLALVEAAMARAADRGVHGALVQILDPAEEAFPYDGRTIFESIGGSLSHETQKAGDLRARYLERLAARKAALRDLARATGWQYHCHLTDSSAANALLWLYHATEQSL
jgi:uncharacterized protein (DUF58 family)